MEDLRGICEEFVTGVSFPNVRDKSASSSLVASKATGIAYSAKPIIDLTTRQNFLLENSDMPRV